MGGILMKKLLLATAILTSATFMGNFLIEKIDAQASSINGYGIKTPIISGMESYRETSLLNTSSGTQFMDINYDFTAKIRDMVTGKVIRTIFNDADSVTANDDATLFIAASHGRSYYATNFEDQQKLNKLSLYEVYGFFKGTNIFVGMEADENDATTLLAYDFDNKKILFKNYIEMDLTPIVAVKDSIAVAKNNNVTIYNQKGNYEDVLPFDSKITDLEYSPDGQFLIVATKGQDLQVLDVKNNYAQVNSNAYANTKNAKYIVFDPTGKYLAFEVNGLDRFKFSLYDFENNKRIYTNLDYQSDTSPILLTPGAKFILMGNNTFSGKYVSNYIYDIDLPTTYLNMEVGQTFKPEITIKLIDGEENISEGVSWKSSDLGLAYYDKKQKVFVAEAAGEITMRISYLGFTKDVKVTIKESKYKEIKEYIDKKTYKGFSLDSMGITNIHLDNRLYNKNGAYNQPFTVSAFTGVKNNNVVTYLDIARQTSLKLNYNKVVIKVKDESLTKKVKSYMVNNYEMIQPVKLSKSDQKWIKKNISKSKTAYIELQGKNKTIRKKLNSVQKEALLNSVLLNEYLISQN